jgi:hypothetical protein
LELRCRRRQRAALRCLVSCACDLDPVRYLPGSAGRTSSGRPPAPGRLDRAAFEAAVADAADLLQLQLRWAGWRS